MKIANFKLKHLSDVMMIEKDAYGKEHWSRDIFYSEFDKRNSYDRILLNDNNKVIGFLISSYLFEEAELLSIAVLKSQRGKGGASLLIEDFINYSKFNGIEKIFLEVKETNSLAKKLYSKFKFRKISQRKNYYSDGTDADVMQLLL